MQASFPVEAYAKNNSIIIGQEKQPNKKDVERELDVLNSSLKGLKHEAKEMKIVGTAGNATDVKANKNQKKTANAKASRQKQIRMQQIKETEKEKKVRAQVIALSKEGLENLLQRRYNEAIKAYSDLIAMEQRDANSYYNRAIAYHHNREYMLAINDYSKAIELYPRNGDAYYNRAVSHHYNGEYNEAIVDYEKTISLNPKDADCYWNRGILLSFQGRHSLAADDYCKAIDIDHSVTKVQTKTD